MKRIIVFVATLIATLNPRLPILEPGPSIVPVSLPPVVTTATSPDSRANEPLAKSSAHVTAAYGACETWITITQYPSSPYEGTTANITVEWGEDTGTIPPCVEGGPAEPETFRFFVNEVDRTSYFSVSEALAVGTAVPMIVGEVNRMEATALGHGSNGSSRTDSDVKSVTVAHHSVLPVTISAKDTVVVGATDVFSYRVRNTGSVSDSYTFSCSVTGPVTCGALDVTSATLAPNQTVDVNLEIQAGTTGGAATVSLNVSGPATARATDSVFVYRPPALSLRASNDLKLVRSDCLTFGAGAQSAVQCGDLMYPHALPGYRSMNESRPFTLLYNSATARPNPVIAADYTTIVGEALPEMLKLEVWRTATGSLLASAYFDNYGFTSAVTQSHRLTLPIDAEAQGLATGAHAVEVKLHLRFNGVWQAPSVVSSRLLIVNRGGSPFGAGWWPAGVERLHPSQDAAGSAMLVLGDGSALLFQKVSGVFRSPPGERSELSAAGTGFKRVLDNNRETVWYSSAGLVDSITDNNPSRNKATYTWSGELLTAITDPVGKQIAVGYDGTSRASQISIPGLATVQLFQSTHGSSQPDLDSIADPDGFRTRFAYVSGNHRMATSTSRGTGQVTYAYDLVNAVDTVSGPGSVGPSKRFRAWQRIGAPAVGTGGSESTPARASLVDSARIIVSWPRSSVRDTARFRVDPFGAPVELQRPASAIVLIDRDSAGRPTHMLSSTGAEMWQGYDASGNLIRSIARVKGGVTDPNTVRYDTTRYEYHSQWRSLTKVVQPEKDSTLFGYDSYGRRSSVTDGLGRQTIFAFTTRGQLATITEPHPSGSGSEPYPTTYTYDPSTLNLTSVTDSTGMMSYAYDATHGSDVLTVTDAHQNTTTYTYDGIKRVRSETRTAGTGGGGSSVVSYTYDDVNRIRTQTDPRNKVSSWTHDAAGRVTQRCIRSGWCEQTSYYDGINPTLITTRKNTQIVQEFDAAGRITRKELGTWPAQDDVILFAYDAAGNLKRVTNRYSVIERGYDAYGRLTSEHQKIREWSDTTRYHGAGVYHEYDRNGRRARSYLGNTVKWVLICTPVPDQYDCMQPSAIRATDTVSYRHDRAGRLDRIDNSLWQLSKGSGSRMWTYSFDAKGRLTNLALPTATPGTHDLSWEYDADDRLTRYWQVNGGPDDRITRNALGQVTQHLMWGLNRTDNFDYDGLGRLKQRTSTHAATETFSYDAAGNRLTDSRWTFNYNDRGQLTSKTDPSCTLSYGYDNNGNLLTQAWQGAICSGDEGRTITYDAGDRMATHQTRISVSGGTRVEDRTYWYDGLGRRILTRSADTLATDYGFTRYWWLDANVAVKTFNLLTDPDLWWPSITRHSNGVTLIGEGEWFYSGPGADEHLGSWNYNRDQTRRHLFIADYRGSVVRVMKPDGTALGLSASTYSAFGSGENAPASAAKNPGFNGHESSGGLVYMRNRWYDPNAGRFTQEDPIGFAGGINLYGYTGGDPVNYSDPFGLCMVAALPCPVFVGGAAAAGPLGLLAGAVAVLYKLDQGANAGGGAPHATPPAAAPSDATRVIPMGRSENRIPIVGGPPNAVVTRPGVSVEYGPDGNAVTRTCAKAGHGCEGAHTHEYTTGPNGKVNQKGKPRPATEEEKNRTPPPNEP